MQGTAFCLNSTKEELCQQKHLRPGPVFQLTLSCSLWTFPCPPGKDTPGSCWCHPSPRPSAHGSVTRGTQWHRTYWRSNPEGINTEQVSPVKLCPCPPAPHTPPPGPRGTLSNMAHRHRGLSLPLMIQPQKPEQARPPLYCFISILLQCIRSLLRLAVGFDVVRRGK